MKPSFHLEVHASCQSRGFSDQYLKAFHLGWFSVANVLREIGVGEIVGLRHLEVTFLDDDEMARLHGEFLSDPTTTDVITFQHGELVIGVEVADRQAVEFGTTPELEIALYGIHGMLHLAGFDDRTVEDSQQMKIRQEELLYEHFSALFSEKE